MMHVVELGQIWRIRGTDRWGLVVFARAGGPTTPEDLRLVPVYPGPAVALASERDVVIPDSENSLGTRLLAACWNARRFESADLETLAGSASATAVTAVRAVEMAGVFPGACEPYVSYCGSPITADEDPRVQFQLDELAAWDAIEEHLRTFRHTVPQVLRREEFAGRLIRAGRQTVAGPLFVDLSGNLVQADHAGAFSFVVLTPAAPIEDDHPARRVA